ncbi:MAG: DNA polymerase III subunit alpha [Patescibacteria group bacterium]|nr:DNA polymerase III subunit alpha [Patescibacteria group bacterium]
MQFTHLHCHSHYSLLDGLSKIDPLVERAKELDMPALALTDHGVMYGAVEFYNKCVELGVKPIIGLEAYVAPRALSEKEGRADADYFHLTLLAQNEQGYQNLMLLTTIAHLDGFYYKPRIDLDVLGRYGQGLICLSGCQRGEIARAALNKSAGEAQKTLEKYLEIFGPNRMFIEVQRNAKTDEGKQAEAELNQKLIGLARQNNLPLVATADCHYIYPEDVEAQDVLVCIGTARTVSDTDRLDMRGYDLSLKTPQQMQELFYDLPEAVANTQKVADMCELKIKTNQRYFPHVEIPSGTTSADFLRQTVYGKAPALYADGDGHIPEAIQTRIDYELDIIIKKGFDTYFLMVADIVQGAHNIGAITNTRGSAAGSIVGYILGITNVDPLYYELPFERFLTLHRPTPPDIDLDIADNRRDEAIAYITQKYGKDKVAQIITFGTMMARAAVRDAGRALGVPYSKCDQIAKMVPLGKQGFHMTLDKALDMSVELKEAYQQDPETKQLLNIAKKIEGNARHASVHAAGIVITPSKLTDYMPLQHEPDGQRIITQYDMYSLDVNSNSKAIGVIKMDLLGIRNLSILESAVKIAQKRHNVSIDIYKLPHPDKKTFKLLSDGLTFGVFQMGSSGMTRYLRELKPSSIFDIMAMIALYRPGPMQFIPDYIARKLDPKLIKYLDPALEKILHRTYGVLVYQDDLLTIAHDLAGYTWEEVDKFRKAVGKKIPEEMAKQKIKFIDGCQKTSGWSFEKATQIWTWIEPFAAYGFNKSHSASYSVVSYQTAYMKANYPVEFMAALMTAESGDEDKIYEAVEECENLGIKVLPPDVNESRDDFTVVDDHAIRFGLGAIKNLGSDVIERVIFARREEPEDQRPPAESRVSPYPFTSLEDFLLRAYVKNFNKKSWEALVKAGALDRFGERGQLLANTEEVLEFTREHFKDQNSGQTSLFGKAFLAAKLKLRQVQPATTDEKLSWEKEHLGMYVSAHPLDNYRRVLGALQTVKNLHLDMLGGHVVMGGIISRLKRTLTRKNDPMAFFTLEDLTGSVEVLVFPKVLEKSLPFLANDKIVQVSGRLSDKDEEFKLIAEEIKELPSDELYHMALAEMEKTKQVVIYMQVLADKAALNEIKGILQKHAGNAQVYLSVGVGMNAKKIKTQSQVRMSNELLAELRTIPEIDKVDAG